MQGSSSVKKRLLYVEDNAANSKLMSSIVSMVPGMEITVTDNAEDGIVKAQEELPEIIFIDINLPGMNGNEALTFFQEIDGLKQKNTLIYVISANAMPDDIHHSMSLGIDGYLTKPVDVGHIIKLLEEV